MNNINPIFSIGIIGTNKCNNGKFYYYDNKIQQILTHDKELSEDELIKHKFDKYIFFERKIKGL